jgi:hypothetical protein
LDKFLIFYNLHRRNGSIRKELKVKTPFNAIEKSYPKFETKLIQLTSTTL